MDYIFLQNYWWFLVSLLGALLVFLLFVQGGNSLLFTLGRNDEERSLLVNSTGRKWEFTFTTLVTFGGGFLRFLPVVLQYQFRRCLLAMDDYPFQLRSAGCFIRVPVQVGQSAWKAYLPMVSGYKRHRRAVVAGGCGSYFLYRFQFSGK